jgi:hypothetical protein
MEREEATLTTAGKRQKTPVELKWGTFCREILVDAANPNDVSLVGILSSLKLTVETRELLPTYELPVRMWAFMVFKFATKKVQEERNYQVSAMIYPPNGEPVLKMLDLVQKPENEYFQLNMHFPLIGKASALRLSEGANSLKISLRYKKTDLGVLELPMNLTAELVPELEASNDGD